VGEIVDFPADESLPRTHRLALVAAQEALDSSPGPVDAVILGGTTGGMPATEDLLKAGIEDAGAYRLHGTGTVAELIAQKFGCDGPVMTVSTACSSGAVALKIGLEMIRSGKAERVLAGGADALCRLTYFGFGMLQLNDPQGTRPLDKNRAGMTVGEGAGVLLLEGADEAPPGAMAELRGGGLSCDAYHSSAPHPEGAGALAAMRAALADAGVAETDIDYLNLHGTGTPNNDVSESAAVRTLFGDSVPPLSSVKGTFGHSLAGAGAVEAAVSCLSIRHGLLPANVGCAELDESLGVSPVMEPTGADVKLVLSNSLGFGGNNAALVFGRPDLPAPAPRGPGPGRFAVLGANCITGAGLTAESFRRFTAGEPVTGVLPAEEATKDLPPRLLRRMKRLPRLSLALVESLLADSAREEPPAGVFLGTGWGPLSETHGFITRLFATGEERSSPTDFVGSVHNAVAGQVAIRHKITGPNVTATGGDTSFEQALYVAGLVGPAQGGLLVIGADEAHPELIPLLDESAALVEPLSDGGGALLLERVNSEREPSGPTICASFPAACGNAPDVVERLVASLGGKERLAAGFGAIFAGIPAAHRKLGEEQLAAFTAATGFAGPVIDYRCRIGEYATAPAVAAVFAVELVRNGTLPASLAGGTECALQGKGLLILSLGKSVAAVEIGSTGPLP